MHSSALPPGYSSIVPVGFNAYIGPILRKDAAGAGDAARFLFVPRAHHLNAGGNVHGGLLMTLADVMLGFTVHEGIPGMIATTAALNTDFISGAHKGDAIEGRAIITRLTRSLVFVGGDLSVSGKLVLSATGIWKIIRERKSD